MTTSPTAPRGAGPAPILTFGCLLLFSLPFAGAGVLIIAEWWRGRVNPSSTPQILVPLMGLAFVGFGLVIFAVGLHAYRNWTTTRVAQQQYPDRPWMWRADWAAGHAADTTGFESIGLWVFAILWNLISWGIAVAILPQLRDPQTRAVWLVLIFPAIGIVLLLAAVRAAIRRRKFGSSLCRPSAMPLRPGTTIRFALQTHLRDRPEHGMIVKLTCVRRVTSRGRNSSTSETVLWQDEETIGSGSLWPGPFGTEAVATFRIPRDAQPTDASNADDQILWRVNAAAEVPGVDYAAHFEVPVYGAPPPPDAAEEREVTAESELHAFDPAQLRGITFSTTPDGGEEIRFAAHRNLGMAFGLTFFAAVFTGAFVAIVMLHAPLIFPIAFGGVSALLFIAAWDAWFATTRVIASRQGLRIRRRWLLFGSSVFIAAEDIEKIAPAIMASSQKGSDADAIYSLEVTVRGGRTRTAGTYIPTSRAGDYLAGRLRNAVSHDAT